MVEQRLSQSEGETLKLGRIRTVTGAVLALLPASSLAQSAPGRQPRGDTAGRNAATVEVIATSPLPGLGIDHDKVPSNA
jgi:hypothetical protein